MAVRKWSTERSTLNEDEDEDGDGIRASDTQLNPFRCGADRRQPEKSLQDSEMLSTSRFETDLRRKLAIAAVGPKGRRWSGGRSEGGAEAAAMRPESRELINQHIDLQSHGQLPVGRTPTDCRCAMHHGQ